MTFLSTLAPCEVVLEACATSHYWGRTLKEYGHTPFLIAPCLVKKYINPEEKNDYNDAQGIFEAFTRPHINFVAIKSSEQQSLTALHRARARLVGNRTQLANQIRALVAEEGYSFPRERKITLRLHEIWGELDGVLQTVLTDLLEEYRFMEEKVKSYTTYIETFVKNNPTAQRLLEIPGIGPITACALLCEVGDFRIFKSGRQFAAWLGVVPRQHSSGGNTQLGGITKAGNGYLRRLMVQGAHTLLRYLDKHKDRHQPLAWMNDLIGVRKCHHNKACLAYVNKMCRIVWAMMVHDRGYNPQHTSLPPVQYRRQVSMA